MQALHVVKGTVLQERFKPTLVFGKVLSGVQSVRKVVVFLI